MIINPKTHKTSSNDRHVLRAALETFIKDGERKLKTAKRQSNIEGIEDDVARAADLLVRFSAV